MAAARIVRWLTPLIDRLIAGRFLSTGGPCWFGPLASPEREPAGATLAALSLPGNKLSELRTSSNTWLDGPELRAFIHERHQWVRIPSVDEEIGHGSCETRFRHGLGRPQPPLPGGTQPARPCVARQVAPALGWAQAPGTTETGRNPPTAVGVTRQN